METTTPERPESSRPPTPLGEGNSSLSFDNRKMSPPGSKTPESTTGCRSPGSPIGDDACPICLGSFTDKCAAGSCLHNFCLVCLKEWAKQRPVCPLCKQSFTKILYDIKSETDYKEWKVPVLYPNELNDSEFRGFRQFLDHYERRFFGYRTTLPRLNRRRTASPSQIPSAHRNSRHHQQSLYQDRGTSLFRFRLSVYTNNIWIQPLSDITGRYRESSPQLYREQPALTHRLVPWVNRELAALLPISRIGVVLSDIMDLINRYPINSREFRHALRPHLGSRARHFAHEFYNFARSPYDVVGHDNAAQYLPHYDEERSSSDDDVIEVEANGGVVELEPLDLSSRVAREETIGNDGSVFISSDTDDDGNSLSNDTAETHNPDPPPSALRLNSLLSRNGNCFSTICPPSSEERTQTSINLEEPGPSGVSSSSSLSVKKENSLERESSDSDDCLIVDILKPKRERTPELIDLSSDSREEDTRREKGSNKTHSKKKTCKHTESKDTFKVAKDRKKPRLDRTSFSLHFSGTLNCQRGEDHTYCTESASPYNHSSNRTESEEEEEKEEEGNRTHDDHESRTSLRGTTTSTRRRRCNVVESDSDSYPERSLELSSRRQRRTAISKQRRHHRTSSRRIVESSVSPSASPLRKARKDRKFKNKKSSKTGKSSSQTTSKEGNCTTSRQPSCRRKVFSSHSSRKSSSTSTKSFKRYRRDSSSSSSSSSSLSCESSSSSSTSISSSTNSSSSTTSSSSSSSSSSSMDNCNQKPISNRLSNLIEDSSRSESVSSLSSASPSLSSSDSEYLPSNALSLKRKATKKPTISTKAVAKKNKKESSSTKQNTSNFNNSSRKSKYSK